MTNKLEQDKNKVINKVWGALPKYVQIIIIILLFLYGLSTAYIFINNSYVEPFLQRKKLENEKIKSQKSLKFRPEEFGVLVSNFQGDINDQFDIQSTYTSTLNAIVNENNIDGIKIKAIPSILDKHFQNHEEARTFGKIFNAEVVIWGNVTYAGIIPNITIVEETSILNNISEKDITLLKESLTFPSISNSADIRFSALTNEPAILIYYIASYKYLRNGNFKDSRYFLDKILKINSDENFKLGSIYSLLSLNYICENNANEALKNADKAINMSNDDDEIFLIYLLLAGAYSLNQKFSQALDLTEGALKIHPDAPVALNNKGLILDRMGNYKLAIKNFNKAITANPENGSTYSNRGLSYFHLEKYNEAINDFDKAINLNPNSSYAYLLNKGNVFKKLNKFEEAIKLYSDGLNAEPNNFSLLKNRGNTYFLAKDYANSINDLSHAINVKSSDANLFNNRGLSYFNIGKIDLALKDFDNAIKINPNYSKAYTNKAIAHAEKKEFDKALHNIEIAEKLTNNVKDREAIQFNRKKIRKLIDSEIQRNSEFREFRQFRGRFT